MIVLSRPFSRKEKLLRMELWLIRTRRALLYARIANVILDIAGSANVCNEILRFIEKYACHFTSK